MAGNDDDNDDDHDIRDEDRVKGNDDDNGVSKTTLQIEAAVARRCFQPVRHETRSDTEGK